MMDTAVTLNYIEGIPRGRLCIGYKNQFNLYDEQSKDTIPLFRTESSRNQAVSAHEIWEDDEPELVLCFTRGLH